VGSADASEPDSSAEIERPERSPAEGERAAVIGYFAQYEVAAGLLLRALTDEVKLRSLTLMHDGAGRLDDFQLITDDQLHAYQVKWSDSGGQMPWRELNGYLVDMVKDRRNLADLHGNLRVIGHLFTNRVPSSGSIHGAPSEGGPYKTNDAVSQLLLPAIEGKFASVEELPQRWSWLWNGLREATELTGEQLLVELGDLRLDFGERLPKQRPLEGGDVERYRRDIDDLYLALTSLAREPRELTRLAREQLISRLPSPWRRRLELVGVHEFPTPTAYERIASSSDDLRAAIEQHHTGYVALVGSPGAGKSTLLTEELKGREDVVARYYAYVPHRGDLGPERAEAANFLHDLVLTLERSGLPRGPGPVDFDVRNLSERLRQQLARLGERFSEDGQRAVVMIDGLDHVDRAEPVMSLFGYLPAPTDIPEGVLFVVGSQTVHMLDQRIITQLAEEGRTVVMRGLDTGSISRLAHQADVDVGADELRRVTDGHPLLLDYVLEQLGEVGADEQSHALAEMQPLGGDVRALYDQLWSGIRDDEDLIELLALISRIRAAIDLQWLRDHGQPPAVVRKLQGGFAHLFRKEPDRWYFFHDSFRVFLQEMTGTPYEGPRYHRLLAEMCSASDASDSMRWEVLFHLAAANAHEEVLELATPEFFRDQIFALRPPTLISADISLAARSLGAVHDPMALVRLAFADAELSQRGYHEPDRKKTLELLLWLGRWQIVVDLLEVERDEFGSDDPRTLPLEMAAVLWRFGHQEEARRLFALNEPYDLLGGQRRSEPYRDPDDLLYAWAQIAVLIQGPQVVLDATAELDLSGVDRLGAGRGEDRTLTVRAWMLALAAEEADDAGLAAETQILLDGLDLEDHTQRMAWARAQLTRARRDENGPASVLEEILMVEPERLSAIQRTAVARLLIDEGRLGDARAWVDGLEQPPLRDSAFEDYWDGEAPRYMLNFVLAALDEEVGSEALVSTSETRHGRSVTQIAKVAVDLAELHGAAVAGKDTTPDELLEKLEAALLPLSSTDGDSLERYPLMQTQPGALATTVRIAEAHGEDHVRAVWRFFKERWARDRPRLLAEGNRVLPRVAQTRAVPTGEIRQIIDDLAAAAGAHSEPSELAKDLIEIARTCLTLGEFDRGKELLEASLRSTLALYPDKDYQLTSWVELLRPKLDQDDGTQTVDWLAGVLADLNDRPAESAARCLLGDEAQSRPASSWALSGWLAGREVIDFDDRLSTLLHGTRDQAHHELWWIAVANAYLPVGGALGRETLKEATASAKATHGDDWAATQLRRIADRIEVDAAPEDRDGWQWELADAAAASELSMGDIGLPTDRHPDVRPPRSRSRGTDENQRDAFLAATNTPEKVLAAFGADEKGDILSRPLDEALERVAPQVTLEQLQKFVALDAALELDHIVVLVKTARRLGQLGLAFELIEMGVGRADSARWRRTYDGGTLLQLMVELWELDSERARHEAYVRFAADASTDRYLLSGIAEDLDSYFDLFGIDDRLGVAAEVEAYVRRLMPEPSELPSREEADERDSLAVLARALTDMLASPYQLGMACGQQTLLAALEANEASVWDQLARCLDPSDPELTLRIFSVLEAFLIGGQSIPEGVLDVVVPWATSEWLTLRLAARSILEAHDVENPPMPRRALPGGLRAIVPQEQRGEWTAEPSFGDERPDDVFEAMRGRLRRLAEAARIDPDALHDHVSGLARGLCGGEPPDDLALRTDRGVLGWTYHGPSFLLWDRGAMLAGAAVADAGLISPETAAYLSTGPLYDPVLIRQRPVRKPAELPGALAGHDERWVSVDSWLAALESAPGRLMVELDDWVVIGELTDVRYLDREMPRERRWQSLGAQGDDDVKAQPVSLSGRLLEHVSLGLVPDGDRPLIGHDDVDYRGPSRWVGLSPFVADSCGWTPSDSGLIAYEDQEGVVAKSLWWRSGWPDSANWTSHAQVGEGWLVLVAPRALTVLEDALDEPLDISWEVERDFLVGGKPKGAKTGKRPLRPEG
jgi:hypothetical protein